MYNNTLIMLGTTRLLGGSKNQQICSKLPNIDKHEAQNINGFF